MEVGRARGLHAVCMRCTIEYRYAVPSALEPDDFPPLSESLQDCQKRLMPFLEGELQPAMTAAVERAKAKAKASGAEYEVLIRLE